MGISYDDALRIVETEAASLSAIFQATSETVPLRSALNRIVSQTYFCPESTPKWDTSAMDGYALNSEATQSASDISPVTFCIKKSIAAGDEPVSMSGEVDNGIRPCAEIMTGARFPICVSGKPFDCCVRFEDTKLISTSSGFDYVQILKPARYNQNKRLAGEDFKKGDVIIRRGSIVQAYHVMALASIGCKEISVLRRPRVALFSTGSELLPQDPGKPNAQRIEDVNGPYISAVLEGYGYETRFVEVIDDNSEVAARKICHQLQEHNYDLFISTGGVSAGKFDSIRESIEKLDARVLFHKVAMRPGHPALFATIPVSNTCHSPNTERLKRVAFFGLPGNPVASAACLRFLVLPFLRILLSQPPEQPVRAKIRRLPVPIDTVRCYPCSDDSSLIAQFPAETDVFRTGQIISREHGILEVGLIQDHSPGKIKPFISGDCWIHVHRGERELKDGDIVDVFPMI